MSSVIWYYFLKLPLTTTVVNRSLFLWQTSCVMDLLIDSKIRNGFNYQYQRWYSCSPWQPLAVLRKWGLKVNVTWLWKRSRLHMLVKCAAAAAGVGLHIDRTAHVSCCFHFDLKSTKFMKKFLLLSLMVRQPNTMPRPSALTGITRYTVQYNDTLYII